MFLRSATTGTDGTVAIEAGTGYPSRFFLFNPPSPSGTISVGSGGEAVVDDANASGEARGYLNGSTIRFGARHLTYSPNCNEYRNPPTAIYENGVFYDEFENEQRVVGERGGLINGRTSSLIVLQGQYSTGTSNSVSLGTTPISSPAQTVSVTDDPAVTGDRITITIPTRLSGPEWEELLSDEEYIADVVKNSNGSVSIYLDEGETYELRMAAVGVNDNFDTEINEGYIVAVSGNGETVPEGGTQEVVVQVRDKYNNPVSNVEVSVALDPHPPTGGDVAPITATADREGRSTFTHEVADDVDAQRRRRLRRRSAAHKPRYSVRQRSHCRCSTLTGAVKTREAVGTRSIPRTCGW